MPPDALAGSDLIVILRVQHLRNIHNYIQTLDIRSILIKCHKSKSIVGFFHLHRWCSLTLPHHRRRRLSLLLRTADAWPEPQATLINAHGGSCTPAKA